MQVSKEYTISQFQDIKERGYAFNEILSKALWGILNGGLGKSFFLLFVLQIVAAAVVTFAIQFNQSRLMEFGPVVLFSVQAVLVTLLFLLIYIILVHFLLRRMGHVILGQEVSLAESVGQSLNPQRLASLIVSGFLMIILTTIGGIFCLLPGIYLMVTFILVPACITFGDKPFSVPLSESSSLLKGNFSGGTFCYCHHVFQLQIRTTTNHCK